jgi:hypothetical protein
MKTLNQTPAAPAQAQHSPLPWHRIDGGRKLQLTEPNARYVDRCVDNAQRLADALKNSIAAMNCALEIGQGLTPFDRKIEATRDAACDALAEWSKSI